MEEYIVKFLVQFYMLIFSGKKEVDLEWKRDSIVIF